MRLGQEHVPQSQVARTLLQVLDDGRVRREALLSRLTNLALVDSISGDALFLDKLLDLRSVS
jgi:hypothetical protein